MEQKYNPEGLKLLLLEIRKDENYKEIISEIFKITIDKGNDGMVSDLLTNLNETFLIPCNELINYFFVREYLTANEIGISDSGIVKYVNLLKKKYGYIIRKSMTILQDPFVVSGFETNFSDSSSYSSIKFLRNDGEYLSGIVTAQQLLVLCQGLTNATLAMLDKGVYNLDLNTIKASIESNNRLSDKLSSLISRSEKID